MFVYFSSHHVYGGYIFNVTNGATAANSAETEVPLIHVYGILNFSGGDIQTHIETGPITSD